MSETGIVLEGKKKTLVFSLTALIIYLAGTMFAINWMEFLENRSILWSPISKISVSLLATLLVLITGKNALSKFDRIMLPLVFITGSIGDMFIVTSTDLNGSPVIFQLGGLSFIVSQGLMAVRNSQAFLVFRKDFTLKKLLFPLCFFTPMAVIYITFFPLFQKAGLVLVASVYTPIVALSLWTSWDTVRSKLLPRRNALMVGFGALSFLTMELIGMVYNAKVPWWGDLFKVFTWLFYIIALLLFAYSGYTLKKAEPKA